MIDLSVGGGPQTKVTFDVGSTGLYILESEVGSDIRMTPLAFTQSYQNGTTFSGHVGETTVTFRTASGEVTTSQLRVGVIENHTCGPHVPNCLAGRAGIMGTRYYQYRLSDGGQATQVYNPLAFLPDNLASGYMVAATGPTPSIIVGLTPDNTHGLPSTPLKPMNPTTPIDQGVGTAWEIKSIDTCFQVGGNAPQCNVTSFDTGEPGAQFTAPSLPTDDLPPGTLVTVTIPSVGISKTFTAGDEQWVNLFGVKAAPEGEPPGFNSGAQFYNSYAIAYDYFSGLAYFSPITSWITGTYRPASDADLGAPGPIAIAGTLVLPEGFSSTRPIFIGNDSIIASAGSATLSGSLSGAATLIVTGPGALTLAGKSVNTGTVLVDGSTLIVEGSTPAPVVLSNALIGGNGSVGGLTALSGGRVAPGNSIGTLTVDGDAAFGRGATYLAELGAPGRSDRIAVGGSVQIAGAELLIVPDATYVPGFGRYTVLTAGGGVLGAFSVRAPDFGTASALFPFLGVSVAQTSTQIGVEVGRSDVSFTRAARTRNQQAAAFGADQLDESSALLEALARLNFVTAPGALDAISGEIYASAQTAMVEDASFTRDVILGRLRQLSSGVHEPAAAWAQGYGGFGENDGDGNAAALERNGGGVVAGIDARLAPAWRAGLVAGAGQSNFDTDARRSSGSAESFTLGAYAGGRPWQGGPALRAGTAYAWLDMEAMRHVAFTAFRDTVSAGYDGGVYQVFGEVAYGMPLGPRNVELEPFVGVGFIDVRTSSFQERGGASALAARSESFSSTTSTIGIRGVSRLAIAEGLLVELHGTAAWQHAFGNRLPGAALALAGQSTPFVVYGVPLSEDSVRLGAGAQMAIGPQTQIGVDYQGAFARDFRENALRGELSMRF